MERADPALMREALRVAERSVVDRPTVPRVGALAVREGELLGRCARGEVGLTIHAEHGLLAHKLRGDRRLAGATLYSTLEPCTIYHHGQPPCVETILASGIRRVVLGIIDPHPIIGGQGYWRLVERGVEVELFTPELARAVAQLLAPYIRMHRAPLSLSRELYMRLTLKKEAWLATNPIRRLVGGSSGDGSGHA